MTDTEDQYSGCVLCVHGKFIPGSYPQTVKCAKLGNVTEKDSCDKFQGQIIAEKDPTNPND